MIILRAYRMKKYEIVDLISRREDWTTAEITEGNGIARDRHRKRSKET